MRIRLLVVMAAAVFLVSTLSSAMGREAQVTGTKASGDLPALYSKGQMELQNGDLDGAEKSFRQVIAIDPNAAGAYSNLGVIAMRRKDWDHALGFLEKAAKLAPKINGVRLNIGLVHYR